MTRLITIISLVLSFCVINVYACSNENLRFQSFNYNKQIFIDEAVAKYHMNREKVTDVVEHAKFNPHVIEKMEQKYEYLPWHTYENYFLTPKRIREGKNYLQHHAKTLKAVYNKYGVNPKIIVAILGVESNYCSIRDEGLFPVLDSLATLALAYPPRGEYFRSELREFILLANELQKNPRSFHGSYAGAIGCPQFMPSSYRYYAVNFNSDGKIDLVNDSKDVIASVANYFVKKGWQRGGLTLVKAKVTGTKYKKLLTDEMKPKYKIEKLKKFGVVPIRKLKDNSYANILEFKSKKRHQYWLALPNFYVITRYNASINYAITVNELASRL